MHYYFTSLDASVVLSFFQTESPCQVWLALGVEVSPLQDVKHSAGAVGRCASAVGVRSQISC